MLGVFAAGRILNPKTARSQLIGGMIWGVGSALHEEAVVDPRYGSFVNHDLAGYHVPVHADIPAIEAIMLDELDDKSNPLGIKGVGELGICGAGAAVANAVYNACGVRVRDYPITPDKILNGFLRAQRGAGARSLAADETARSALGARVFQIPLGAIASETPRPSVMSTSHRSAPARSAKRRDDARLRANIGREAAPTAHGGKFLGRHGGRRVELVDRRPELGRGPPALPAVAFGDLADGGIPPARQHARTGERVGQVDLVVPAAPVGFDLGIDFSGHDQ